MPTYGGWTGKTLRVDLTTRTSTVEDTLEKYKDFWGGTGMAYKVLWDEVPNTDTTRSTPSQPDHLRLGPPHGHRRSVRRPYRHHVAVAAAPVPRGDHRPHGRSLQR